MLATIHETSPPQLNSKQISKLDNFEKIEVRNNSGDHFCATAKTSYGESIGLLISTAGTTTKLPENFAPAASYGQLILGSSSGHPAWIMPSGDLVFLQEITGEALYLNKYDNCIYGWCLRNKLRRPFWCNADGSSNAFEVADITSIKGYHIEPTAINQANGNVFVVAFRNTVTKLGRPFLLNPQGHGIQTLKVPEFSKAGSGRILTANLGFYTGVWHTGDRSLLFQISSDSSWKTFRSFLPHMKNVFLGRNFAVVNIQQKFPPFIYGGERAVLFASLSGVTLLNIHHLQPYPAETQDRLTVSNCNAHGLIGNTVLISGIADGSRDIAWFLVQVNTD